MNIARIWEKRKYEITIALLLIGLVSTYIRLELAEDRLDALEAGRAFISDNEVGVRFERREDAGGAASAELAVGHSAARIAVRGRDERTIEIQTARRDGGGPEVLITSGRSCLALGIDNDGQPYVTGVDATGARTIEFGR